MDTQPDSGMSQNNTRICDAAGVETRHRRLHSMNAKWIERFVELAAHISQWSKDPSLQVGAVIIRPDRTVASVGFNGLPRAWKTMWSVWATATRNCATRSTQSSTRSSPPRSRSPATRSWSTRSSPAPNAPPPSSRQGSPRSSVQGSPVLRHVRIMCRRLRHVGVPPSRLHAPCSMKQGSWSGGSKITKFVARSYLSGNRTKRPESCLDRVNLI